MARSMPQPRREATSSAYRRMRDLIVAGRLAPGAPLVEAELSARLGVSRTPVRAALQRLQQEGFAGASKAGTMLRAIVAPLTAGDMREVFLMVGALEATAARLAAGLDPDPRAMLADALATLAADLRTASASRPPDVVGAHDLHARFHRTFATAAAGPRLLAELGVLQPQAERYERVYSSAVVSAVDEAARDHSGHRGRAASRRRGRCRARGGARLARRRRALCAGGDDTRRAGQLVARQPDESLT